MTPSPPPPFDCEIFSPCWCAVAGRENNPHCKDKNPVQFSIALKDLVHTWNKSTKEELLMGFTVLVVIVLLIKMLHELTRKKDMKNTRTTNQK